MLIKESQTTQADLRRPGSRVETTSCPPSPAKWAASELKLLFSKDPIRQVRGWLQQGHSVCRPTANKIQKELGAHSRHHPNIPITKLAERLHSAPKTADRSMSSCAPPRPAARGHCRLLGTQEGAVTAGTRSSGSASHAGGNKNRAAPRKQLNSPRPTQQLLAWALTAEK